MVSIFDNPYRATDNYIIKNTMCEPDLILDIPGNYDCYNWALVLSNINFWNEVLQSYSKLRYLHPSRSWNVCLVLL